MSTKFIDPEKVLFAAGLTSNQTVADFGAGSGFYSLAAAKIVGDGGMVYSLDIQEPVLDHIAAEARLKKLRNIRTIQADLEQKEAIKEIPAGTVDLVLLVNISHQLKNLVNIYAEAYRVLKSGGKVLVVEWNDQPGPVGPTSGTRITESEVSKAAIKATFKPAGTLHVGSYHYGLIFIK
ncbi:MAG: hypothetical protein A3I07_01080 [Candidatus Doudnabacteria bacterium RIFCSPLOWO2_02_FULL_42_9]|uniref:Methyltransferase domain-containing protein n=1 Tax=Candidatus Doudnabacteria bacterium RIFCSPHIGHO2_01_FULL_41_86 TaxID=1817821 RepID=A0A1F5N7I0_9BACT|nr:MAG: hypothetical protein A2717_00090 [Candidatus Doudnabacteria bacterium RIFCSPHIGHO2_01_FULL_41_86]OGE74966.1 MAG: hypothetical protein A3K07_03580 [Candidatus Doudnabacteria bacterium RIFCSPHIGHO2_01_43_10]OGE85621.1 MAG: hypothetical protein A3E28_04655 [Candidatus Doudnabacteria bacterium RIFCSPHIGHO2_12_FULL_42_22]OGE86558.1 MAG: hypothetical protein A3C49_00090 [Candidatus Doudnabacteria bacterium RIFCSPHIGHO2_02_FULL_42_25]OGE91975.1 MAG: hypothetical protein A2895_01235 [Candidatus